MSDYHVNGMHIGTFMRSLGEQLEKKTDRNRMCLFPVKDIETYRNYEKQLQVFWSFKSHDYNRDKPHYQSLPKPIQTLIKYPNAFFANGDGLIINNISCRLLLTAVEPEEIAWYALQIGVETVHAGAYNNIIDAIIDDPKEKKELFNAVSSLPSVQAISEWMKSKTYAECSRAEVLVAFACGEGLLFPTSFIPIFYMMLKNKMPTMVDLNKEIARDESLHFEQGVLLINRALQQGEITKQRITEIVQECTEILFKYIDDMCHDLEHASPEQLVGEDGIDYQDFRKSDLVSFARYNADMMLKSVGCDTIYNVNIQSIPPWILSLSCEHKNNFHERVSVNYVQRPEVISSDVDYDV